jgi:hypothetical protein
MILLTAQRADNTVYLVIVMGNDNVERIKQYDPVEVIWKELPWKLSSRVPHTIGISYATGEEMAAIEKLAAEGKSNEALALVTRGWQYHPEKGDHDFGPTVLGKPTKGPKQ